MLVNTTKNYMYARAQTQKHWQESSDRKRKASPTSRTQCLFRRWHIEFQLYGSQSESQLSCVVRNLISLFAFLDRPLQHSRDGSFRRTCMFTASLGSSRAVQIEPHPGFYAALDLTTLPIHGCMRNVVQPLLTVVLFNHIADDRRQFFVLTI